MPKFSRVKKYGGFIIARHNGTCDFYVYSPYNWVYRRLSCYIFRGSSVKACEYFIDADFVEDEEECN